MQMVQHKINIEIGFKEMSEILKRLSYCRVAVPEQSLV